MPRRDLDRSVRFGGSDCDLRNQAIGGESKGRGESEFLSDGFLDALAVVVEIAQKSFTAAEIQIEFVDGGLMDGGEILAEEFVDGGGVCGVGFRGRT